FQKLYLEPVLRSFALSAGATVACLLIGFPVAFTIARAKGRRQALLLLGVMIPFWTSFVVRTYGIYNVIADNGPLYHLLHSLGLVHGYIHLLFTPIGVGIGIVYTYLPLMILPLFVALERIDRGLHSGRDPGHRRVRDPPDPRRRHHSDVRQRGVRPVPQPRQLPVRGRPRGVAHGGADGGVDVPAFAQLQGRGGGGMRLRRPRAASVFTGLVLVCLYAPIITVIVFSVDKDPNLISWKGFTTHWYAQACSDPQVRRDLLTSLEVAALSTVISLAIAICAGLWSRQAGARARRFFDGLTYSRIVLPEVVFALGLLVLFNKLHIAYGVGAIVLGHVVFNPPTPRSS